jgi:hypothetical protein
VLVVSNVLRFPSGERYELTGLPRVSSGRTTLAGGSEGAVLLPALAEPLPPSGFARLSESRLRALAADLGQVLENEALTDCGAPWFEWAAGVERQAIAELARRAL